MKDMHTTVNYRLHCVILWVW